MPNLRALAKSRKYPTVPLPNVGQSMRWHSGKAPPSCARQVAQFFFQREGSWQEGHLSAKQMPTQ